MISRAITSGVTKLFLPNIDEKSISGMEQLCSKYPDHCFPMMGLHPCSVKPDFHQTLNKMEKLLETGNYYGVGETGIDLYWDVTFQKEQEESFIRHIEWALAFDLPVIIHSRESQDLTIDIIGRFQNGKLRGIFHCFGGTVEQAKRIEDLGFMLGIGGVITFKKSDLRDVVKFVSPACLVLETDSPYLAPTPHRGKRNESAYIHLIASELATALEMSPGELSELTNSNANRVFQKEALNLHSN